LELAGTASNRLRARALETGVGPRVTSWNRSVSRAAEGNGRPQPTEPDGRLVDNLCRATPPAREKLHHTKQNTNMEGLALAPRIPRARVASPDHAPAARRIAAP